MQFRVFQHSGAAAGRPAHGRRAGARATALAAALVLGAIAPLPAVAAEVANLYTARVPWNAAEDSDRRDAYAAALGEVLVRVTGRRDAAGDPVLLAAFPNPADYVIGYRRAPEETLWVSFDGRSVESILTGVDASVWGIDRPLTVVWLAVDRGRGERELLVAGEPTSAGAAAQGADPNDQLRERLSVQAMRRGIPLLFPLGDTEDRARVTVGDIWGGFVDPIVGQSERYGATSVLIGRGSQDAADRIRWTWLFGGDRRDFSGPVEAAVNRVTDGMAGLLAVSGSSRRLSIVLDVEGLTTVNAYGATLKHLRALPQIKALDVRFASGDVVRFDIEAIGRLEQLSRALTGSGLLRPLPSGGALPRADDPDNLAVDYLRVDYEG